MKKKKKVGILGGTFNPIHLGHLYLAECAVKAAALDEVLFIPSGVSYMKDQREILSPLERLEMVKLAIQDIPEFKVSTIEIEKEGNSYSYETIATLKKIEPEVEYFFIIGADTLFSMESWKKPESILGEVTILAAYRSGVSLEALKQQIAYLQKKYLADIRLIAVDRVDISSSEIREAIRNGETVHEMLSQSVEDYIKTHCFYNKSF